MRVILFEISSFFEVIGTICLVIFFIFFVRLIVTYLIGGVAWLTNMRFRMRGGIVVSPTSISDMHQGIKDYANKIVMVVKKSNKHWKVKYITIRKKEKINNPENLNEKIIMLNKLSILRDKGILNDQELDFLKSQILNNQIE